MVITTNRQAMVLMVRFRMVAQLRHGPGNQTPSQQPLSRITDIVKLQPIFWTESMALGRALCVNNNLKKVRSTMAYKAFFLR